MAEAILIFTAWVVFALLAVSLMRRFIVEAKWHRRFWHSCGWSSRFQIDTRKGFCPYCGGLAEPRDFTSRIARAAWPWGWTVMARYEDLGE
jgi:hypothetical protein